MEDMRRGELAVPSRSELLPYACVPLAVRAMTVFDGSRVEGARQRPLTSGRQVHVFENDNAMLVEQLLYAVKSPRDQRRRTQTETNELETNTWNSADERLLISLIPATITPNCSLRTRLPTLAA